MEPPPASSPRISFSADFLEEKDFISICPADSDAQRDKGTGRNPTEFEFISMGEINTTITADELFFEGKLLPFWQMQLSDKIRRNTGEEQTPEKPKTDEEAVCLFLDHDDPSPRLPKCTVLWKELLKLRKKNKAASSSSSSLSPSSSTSSSSSGGSLPDSLSEQGSRRKRPGKTTKMDKGGNKSTPIIKVRPVINVQICTPRKSTSSLSPLFNFPMKKGNLEM